MGRRAEFGGGGGLFSNKDYTCLGYQFTTDPPFANTGGYVYCTIDQQEDGKDTADNQSLFVGDPASFEISKDGLELTPEGGARIGRDTPLARFMSSMQEPTEGGEGHPGVMDDDESVIAFRPIIGSRYRLVQQPLDVAELAKLKAKGKATTRKGKDGKEYPLTNTVVAKFYSVGSGKPSKGSGKPASASGGKVKAQAVDVAALATDALQAVLRAAPDQTLAVARAITKVGLNVMQRDEPEAGQAEAVKKWLGDPANLDDVDGVMFNAKKQMVTLDE